MWQTIEKAASERLPVLFGEPEMTGQAGRTP
jgi:hypothetical protein